MQFIKSNYMYVLWFILYFTIVWCLFGANADAFILTCLIYSISISIALSPIGEWLLRFFESARPLRTNQEIEYLQPLFDEVYQNALEENPKLSNNIKLYIIDAMFVNAFAMGRKTIAVTKGAIETFNQEELKGVLAHEFGHISYGHTKALLLTVVGNFILSFFVFLFRTFIKIMGLISSIFASTSPAMLIVNIINWIFSILFEITFFLFIYLGQIILSLNSRSNEYQADSFAYQIGFGEELTQSLYLLQKISMTQKMTLKEKLTSSHPHITQRIERLENMNQQIKVNVALN